MALEPRILVLDTTAFIRLDFPLLQTTNAQFYTTPGVMSELKDSKSRMNLDVLKYSDRLKLNSPLNKLVKELEKRIQMIDPLTTLSQVDIEVLALTLQVKGSLVSNDLNLQNTALQLNIPVKVISGKKITDLRKWQLKCRSCGQEYKDPEDICLICGGSLKRVLIEKTKLNLDLIE